ncbi:hypothetical protein AX16_000752 [Volvariella volvacea WC 439]|nr:hypothetical protein AX16_000752 [Volvariella volvacea WC 439]
MRFFVELRDETVVQIPFREASKNWQWDGQTKSPFPRPRKRDHAYIHVTAGDRSSISYVMPMVPGPQGFESSLEVHLDTIAVTSSLNDIRLVSAETCRVRCDMPAPLKWNAERKWTIAVKLRQPVLYLLRDHINMFTDLGKDWASGPPNDYLRYIPMTYTIESELHHYNLHLYVNDHNIIDKPLLNEENALLILKGQYLKAGATVPANTFRSESTTVPFHVNSPDIAVYLSLPRWNTNALHSPPDGNNIGKIGSFAIDGSYHYFSEVHPNYVEQLKLNFHARKLVFKAVGWSIRYFMILKDNYFGSFTHFSTLSEYLKNRKMKRIGDPIEAKYREGKSNVFQVQMSVFVNDGQMVLPAGLPGYEGGIELVGTQPTVGSCLVLAIPELQVQFRMHDHYMEMSLNIGTTMGYIKDAFPDQVVYVPLPVQKNDAPIYIDGIDITAHRLFGPQPRTATYLCIWEVHVGSIRSALSAPEAGLLLAAADAFQLNYVDSVNAPAEEYLPPLDPDVTFLKVSLDKLNIMWRAGCAVLMFSMPQGLNLESSDLGGQFYKKVTTLRIPSMSTQVLLTASPERKPWLEAAAFKTDVFMDIYVAPQDWREKSAAQLRFIEEQDRLTSRARRLITSLTRHGRTPPARRSAHENGLYIPQPALTHRQPGRRRPESSTEQRGRSSSQGSESDAVEVISEADRDACLVRARSLTPLRITKEEDQNMTSGDESDNEDLTEGSTSDSDWSEDEGSDPCKEAGRSLLSFYSHLVNHYHGHYLGRPALWSESPFAVTKERPTPHPEHLEDRDIEEMEGLYQPPTPIRETEGFDLTIFRARCKGGIAIKLTPLILCAARFFEEDLFKEEPSPELQLDSLMTKFLLKKAPPKEDTKIEVFDIQIPFIGISIRHHLAMDGGLPVLLSKPIPLRAPTAFDALATLLCEAASISAIAVIGGRNPSLDSRLGRLSFAFKTSPTNRPTHVPITPHNETELTCYLHGARLLQKGTLLEGSWGEFSIRISHHTAYFLAATALSLVQVQKQLMAAYERVRERNEQKVRGTICHIIQSSKGRDFVEPLSTIQPSFLVQSGVPQDLRTNVVFRLLFHLRNCLWRLKGDAQPSSSPRLNRAEAQSLDASLLYCLEYLEPDAASSDNLWSVESLFMKTRPKTQMQPSSLPFRTLSLRLTLVTITATEPTGRSSSTVQFTDIHAQATFQTFYLVQSPALASPGSLSSLREPTPTRTIKLFALISFGTVELAIYPHMMRFVEHILRARRHYINSQEPRGIARPRDNKQVAFPITSIEVVGLIHHLRVQAIAKSLMFEFGTKELKLTTSVLLQSLTTRRGVSLSNAVFFEEVFFRARSPSMKQNGHDILAALELSSAKFTLFLKEDRNSRLSTRGVYVLESIRFQVPRSALRLYYFVDEWRNDFSAELGDILQALLKEVQKAPTKSASPALTHTSSRLPMVQIQGIVKLFCVSLQIMHGTWLDWNIHETMAFVNTVHAVAVLPTFSVGLQIGSQVFTVSTRANGTTDTLVKMVLPCVSLAGKYNEAFLQAHTMIDPVDLRVKPSHLDTLLGVQQKFDQDFNDLLALVREKRSQPPATPTTPVPPRMTFRYSLFIKIQRFGIGLEGHSSILYLQCEDVGGGLHSDLNEHRERWYLIMTNLALSLAPRTTRTASHTISPKHRSAFVIIDVRASAGSDAHSNHVLSADVTKLHAVMQPSAIGEIGDFIDHLQAEVMERKEQRAQELAAFKEKAQNLLQTLEVVSSIPQPTEESSWLDDYVIRLAVFDLGVAFPLSLDQELEIPQTGGASSTTVRAFLFAIKSIEFSAQRGESGQAVMKGFSFQFVSSFKQSDSKSFSGDKHQTRNRLIYPEMKAQLRSKKIGATRRVQIVADVSGFILDLDSSIPDYVFSLVDVYRQGKARVERLAAMAPRTPLPVEDIAPSQPPSGKLRSDVLISNVIGSLTFASGTVRIHSIGAAVFPRSRSLSHAKHEPSEDLGFEEGADVFCLPIVSVWAEYRAAPSSSKIPVDQDDDVATSLLIFKSTVHSSQNTLHPTLLPFMTELVSHIEARMRRISLRPELPSSLAVPTLRSSITPLEPETMPSVASLQISFSLRIDQSKLELTCQPDVNVVAGVHWESGGFMINISPGARKVNFSGSVGGLMVGLKHGFLSENCVKLDARNLAFSVNFSKFSREEAPTNTLSITLDTQFWGEVRFSRLQDILCFKAVWLDRIPVFNQPITTPGKATKTSPLPPPQSQPKASFSTVVLLHIREIELEVDLGQSISLATLNLQDALMQTKLTDSIRELSVLVANVVIYATGNLSGRVTVPNCIFSTSRRMGIESASGVESSRMLELRMTSGALVAHAKSGEQQLLQYHAQPLEIEVVDDWSLIADQTADESSPLQLSFNVTSPEIAAAITVGTIPRIMSYAAKFKANLDAQREGASRESKTFRITRTPKPDNPLSAVAEAMLDSARSRFREAGSGLLYAIKQKMSLRLAMLRLVLFPRTMEDLEMAQFVGQGVHARLVRSLDSDNMPIKRDIRLSFSSMVISKFAQLNHSKTEALPDIRNWLRTITQNAPEATIVGLPSMKMHMASEQDLEDVLIYDFDSTFVRGPEGHGPDYEDIYITLNVSLYSWLTVLRKNLTREMDQVKASTARRETTPGARTRKRGTESVDISRTPTMQSSVPEVPPLPLPVTRSSADKGEPPIPSTSAVPVLGPSIPPNTSIPFPSAKEAATDQPPPLAGKGTKIQYQFRNRHIERLTMRQLGEATPDVMHPFFMKKAGFNLEDSLPQYVHEYATIPLEEIMEVLLAVYSRQLLSGDRKRQLEK